jgi:transcriptional regulator NrdR family protein
MDKTTDEKLIEDLLRRKWECEYCHHRFTEEELKYLISSTYADNQNCPKCGKLNL